MTLTPAADLLALDAVDSARAAVLEDVDGADLGDHLGHLVEAGGVVTHFFACRRAGYVGWRWAVTIAQVEGGPVTVDEVVLLPGEEAVVAPAWVPYRERIKPGDLSPGDVLPVADDDPRLVPVYSFGDDPLDTDAKAQVRRVAAGIGLGRVRTLGPEGLDMAAERWYAGAAGPFVPVAQAAPEQCASCGFLVRINGHLAAYFGVCANGDANDDGKVVSVDHGCGAHSEVRLAKRQAPRPLPEPVWDTLTVDDLDAW